MIQAVNADAERGGLRVRVRQMDAEHLDFLDAAFDRVLCGFGIMFLPDQVRGLREMRRVLRPGGRLGLSTWQKTEAHDLGLVLNDLGIMTGPNPGWITEPAALAALLTEAGFSDVQIEEDVHRFHHADLDAYWRGARGTGMRRNIDALDVEQAARVRAALAEHLEQYRDADGYHVPAVALIGTATR